MIEVYRSEEMAALWDPQAVLERWTRVELAVCEAWAAREEIPAEEMRVLRERAKAPTPARVGEIEEETNHDVVAFVRALAERIDHPASRHIHRGLTSSDVLDTALAMGIRDSLDVLRRSLEELMNTVSRGADRHRHTACMGRTHGMHAEPTSFGLRLAGWLTELDRAKVRLVRARETIAVGKLSGAVGTYSQTDPDLEAAALEGLKLVVEPVSTQVVPRDRHAEVLSALALLGSSLERMATELRGLSLEEIDELREGGSTGDRAEDRAPLACEHLTGMARLLRGHMLAAYENVALWHDRDISHSSVERVILPDSFHLAHTMLRSFTQVVEELEVRTDAMAAGLERSRGLVQSQSVLTALLAKGMLRKDAYARVQAAAMKVVSGEVEHFRAALLADEELGRHLDADELDEVFDLQRHLGHVDAILARAGVTREAEVSV